MQVYVFRNNTIERFFPHDYSFSGYNDISVIPQEAMRYVWCYQLPIEANACRVAQMIELYEKNLDYVLNRISESKLLIAFTIENRWRLKYVETDDRLSKAINHYNDFLYNKCETNKNLKIIDISEFSTSYSIEQLIDWKYFFAYQIPYNPKLAKDFQIWFERKISQIDLQRKKCLVLDLDNTIWSGIVEEDGMEGIVCSGDYPGNVFHLWQEMLLELSKKGVMLVICSKNDEQEIMQLFEKNPNLVLRKEHFVAWRINWNDKVSNIKQLANDLNIGLESMVFVDDNPTERAWVKQQLPQVEVPDFPQYAYLIPDFGRQIIEKYFSVYQLTDEDLSKTKQYKDNVVRQQELTKFKDFGDYLRSLNLHLTIERANEYSVSRIAQMTQKTNQFNLTTHRYSESDIKQFIAQGWYIYTLAVADKFGDSGITGCMIIKPNYEIDTMLLSCRILGKGIEKAFFCYVMNQLQESENITAVYVPTERNKQVENFYESVGMELYETKDCIKYYRNAKKMQFEISNIYSIN